jgi:hypothetical protein
MLSCVTYAASYARSDVLSPQHIVAPRASVSRPPDAVIVVPPPSPSDTNPPLGPALLRAEGRDAGLEIDVVDLNMEYIRRVAGDRLPRRSQTLGDHGKDRSLLQEAAQRVFCMFGFRPDDRLHVPEGADARAGMHVTNEALRRRTADFMAEQPEFVQWMLARVLRWSRPPAVVGVSIMGPSQVFLALVLARAIKGVSPTSMVVFGGTHMTLLRGPWSAGAMYRGDVDGCLFGHAEQEFVSLVARVTGQQGAIGSGDGAPRHFRYVPDFADEHLSLYARGSVTLPVQFSRGCSYAKCTYCTYPAVEPTVHGLRIEDAVTTFETLAERYGIRRFSLKDSLVPASVLDLLAAEIISSGNRPFEWAVTTKASRALIPLAAQLGESGMRTMELGIETTAADTQRAIRKRADVGMVEELVYALIGAGIVPVINLMFGFPGQSRQEAERDLDWYRALRAATAPGMLNCSLNLVEVVRGSPMAEVGMPGLRRGGIAPWAFAHTWNAPRWRGAFAETLRHEELRS